MALYNNVSEHAAAAFEHEHADAAAERRARVFRWVGLVIILLIVIVQPVSHVGLNHSWPDQSKFYEALTAALHHSPNPLVDKGWVGPGYVAVAVLLDRVVSIRPEDALVLLNRLCFLGTVAVVGWFVLIMPHSGRLARDQLIKITAGFGYLFCLVHTNGLTFFSDIPWSHFVASFFTVLTMALVLAACRSHRTSAKILILIGAGMALGLLTGTRLFEGMAAIAALMLAYGFSAIRKPNRTAFALRRFVSASFLMLISGVATYVSCLQLSGARQIAMFYFSAGLSPVITRIYPLTFLDKFFQIFIDPSFDTVHHPFNFRNAFQQAWSPSFAGWSMPLLLQAPILIYLLAALIPIAVGTFFFKRRDLSAEAASLRAALIVGISLLVGYTTSFVDGSPNLGSGMIRDYMPVIWCLAIAGAPSLSSLWMSRAPKRIPLTLCGACIIMIAIGESAAAFGFWPTYAPRHIARAIVTPTCRNGDCTLSLSYANSRGELWHETKDILLASIDCDGVEKRIALFGPNYHFHECPGAISGVVFPRLTGLGAQPIDDMPFGFTFRLPRPTAGHLSATYIFGLGTATHSLLVKGWSANQQGLVWSDARSATISIPPQPFKPGTTVKVDLAVTPLIFAGRKQQRVMIRVGTLPYQQFVLSGQLADLFTSHVTIGNGDLIVSLELPDATSPISLGLNSDPRLLAIALRRITVSSVQTAP